MAIGGPGVPLPYPTNPYPAQPAVPGVSSAVWTNRFTLLRATLWQIPPGNWAFVCGTHSQLVFLDPVTQTYVPLCALGGDDQINSDGTNYYLFNPSGTPVGIATVGTPGTGYVAATTTVTASGGGSTWRALVDGTVGSYTVGNDRFGNAGGTNFTIPPIVVVQSPPSPGVPATAHAVLTAGAVSSIVIDTAGAGYTSAPGVFLIPDPTDPNAGIITIPAVTATLATPVGAITAILQTYHGTAVGVAPTLTIAGAGASGAATTTLAATAGDDQIVVQWLGSSG